MVTCWGKGGLVFGVVGVGRGRKGEGIVGFEGKGGGRYRRGPGGAAAATIRDDGVGGWGEGGVVAVVCGG